MVRKVPGCRRQVSTIPRSELLMTQVGPPDWATTTLRADMVRSILSRPKSTVFRPGTALLIGAMGNRPAIRRRGMPGRFLLDCSMRRRIKASPERPARLHSRSGPFHFRSAVGSVSRKWVIGPLGQLGLEDLAIALEFAFPQCRVGVAGVPDRDIGPQHRHIRPPQRRQDLLVYRIRPAH